MNPGKSVVAAVEAARDVQGSVGKAIELAGGLDLEGKKTVLIKPNVVFGLRPSTGVVTNPLVVEGTIKYLIGRGIKSGNITIGECSAMGYDTKKAFRLSGFSDMCSRHDVKTVEFFESGRSVTKEIKYQGRKIPIEIAEEVFESDLLINIPVIKTHFQSGVSMALKNMFGVVSWESRKALHKMGLANGIAYLNSVLPGYFTVGDATIGLQGKGPALLGEPGNWGLVFASRDPVAHDSAICGLFGLERPAHVRKAAELGLGSADIGKIKLVGEKADSIKRIAKPATPDISPIEGVSITDGDACSYCMNYVWTALLMLSKKQLKGRKKVQVLIGNLIKDCQINSDRRKVVCGDCALKYSSLTGNVVPGCPPKMDDILKALRKAMEE